MSGSNRYVLDTNVFVEAKNRYYGFGVCPGFWNALVALHTRDRLCSVDKVQEELTDVGDELSVWAKDKVPKTFFKKTQDQAVVSAFQEQVAWVNSQAQFKPEAKAQFASAADGWVIAFAKANGLIVVTHEEYAAAAQKSVPMPNLCLEFNVGYVDTFKMLEDLNVRFILSTKRRRRR
jgi:hypothetical protein